MTEFWTIPRIWEGATCYILAGGPSLATVSLEALYDKRVIAINDAYKLHQWDCLYFKDQCWYERDCSLEDDRPNSEMILCFAGLRVTNCESLLGKPGIKVCRRGQRTGIELRPQHLNQGACAGQEAIVLAVRFGVAKIVLLGYDMKVSDDRHNWHSNHKRKIPQTVYEDQFIPRFAGMNSAAEKMGIEIVNCTKDSILKEFPYAPLSSHL